MTVIFAMFVFFGIKSDTGGFNAAGSVTLLDQLINFELVTVLIEVEGYKINPMSLVSNRWCMPWLGH